MKTAKPTQGPITVERALIEAIEALAARIKALEHEVNALWLMEACAECGVVFLSRDAYAEHLCQGKQGRRG